MSEVEPGIEPEPERFRLETPTIRLGDLVKVAFGISGGEAKHAVQGGLVEVDGRVETRRGRQLRGGERVALQGAGAVVLVPLS